MTNKRSAPLPDFIEHLGRQPKQQVYDSDIETIPIVTIYSITITQSPSPYNNNPTNTHISFVANHKDTEWATRGLFPQLVSIQSHRVVEHGSLHIKALQTSQLAEQAKTQSTDVRIFREMYWLDSFDPDQDDVQLAHNGKQPNIVRWRLSPFHTAPENTVCEVVVEQWVSLDSQAYKRAETRHLLEQQMMNLEQEESAMYNRHVRSLNSR